MTNTPESLPASSLSSPGIPLPARVIVSMRAGFLLAIANVACAMIIALAYTHVKAGVKVINVTGSAKKAIRSDLIVWQANVNASHTDLVAAYDALIAATEKTVAWLKAEGVVDREIGLSAVRTMKNRARDESGNLTDQITSYELAQTVQVESAEVMKISDVARRVTGLIKEGVAVDSEAPTYLYTKLADLKIAMLAEATKDATIRAQQIAGNSAATLGPIRDARMGVMQINPIHSNDVSDYGNNDTSSLDKEITAVVSAQFELR